MKKLYFLLLALGFFSGVDAQIINIPDVNLKAKLLQADYTNSIATSNSYNIKIDLNDNQEIEVNEVLQVECLYINNSNINSLQGLEYFNNLKILDCKGNNLNSLSNISLLNLEDLNCSGNQLTTFSEINGMTSLKRLFCGNGNPFTSLSSINGMNNLITLDCSYTPSFNLSSISNMIHLKEFICNGCDLTSLSQIYGLTDLEVIFCQYNNLTSIDISSLFNLKRLYCDFNLLSTLILNSSSILDTLSCQNNNLTTLDLSGLSNLSSLSCNDNQIVNLDLEGLNSLSVLQCGNNPIAVLDFSQSPLIYDLNTYGNSMLNILDVSNLTYLNTLNCSNNNLNTLFLKNGSNEFDLNFEGNPNLYFICADESQVNNIQDMITAYGYTNCHVNSYCSFIPGGTFYTIQGDNKFDENNNGCDAFDVALSNLKFNITDGTNSGGLISNTTGNYSIPVVAGTHTITPTFENPTYFTASPSSVDVTFPTQTSPFTQNFCISPNGLHPDLEITLLPLFPARPGFDAKYILIYKNKGNTTQSGTVNLAFNDAVLDFVTASPVVTTQTVNNLSWNFTNLLPFESREIAFTLNVNSPMGTPAVNAGDVLNYIATVTSPATDDLPNDNTFTFNQTVVNSFDPNDKACLEGATIPPSKVGDYVHYMIRFENNGTANAQNIVVKDIIDTNKFDISSLVPIKGSHSFVTNISAGNKVEFIFENINLPFDDANNDGYISFKVKTKPTLINGDTFSNSASIYFDYNFPIVTNTATTTIQALSRQDFEFSTYFKLYPNPVNSALNIDAKDTIQISSISIYNTLGQVVLVIPNTQNVKVVDVSGLAPGNYFIKINSDKGISNTKFIKQ